ncbi:hypothetical protein GW17_00001763, partial [Ensete ventricosum]
PVCASSPTIVSVWSCSSVGWVEPRGPAWEVGCWNGGARVGLKYSSSDWSLTPARRSGRVGSRRDPSDGQVSSVVGFLIPLLRRGARAFIVSVIGHSYLISLLPLLLTIPSFLTMSSVVLTARRAPAGNGCQPCPSYLCYVSRMTADPFMPVSDRLPRVGSTTSTGQLSEGTRT